MKRTTAFLLAMAIALGLCLSPALADIVLEVGSSGANVTKVQNRLIQYGYMTGSADGKYGEKTRDAVILFQKRNGLTVDGRVGKATAAALGVTLTSSTSSSSSTIVSADQKLLAKLVYAEARGESYKGQVAVAAVVLNRVSSSSFPNTISGVIYQTGAFSCVSNGSINNTPNDTAVRAALDAMNGWDPTNGCLYYYNPGKTSDSWIRTRTVVTVIGNHYFAR
ncbi:MAG: spore cortex-lytic enzyme [Eubacteriales bacterium]|nr:spore cortex-lytic enzyme [Clostridiales bacterium]MDY2769491.1 spore cortex-lytic enzyme [Eubacteriales bacterium]